MMSPKIAVSKFKSAADARSPEIQEKAGLRGAKILKTPEGDVLRVVPLGGLEEIGRNCAFLEYKNEIVILDMGIQFPEEETPGIDYIIPNLSYLEKKKENIRALVLSHAHYDHIGAVQYVMGKIGNPPIYATALTKEIVAKRQEDFPNAPKPKFITVKNNDSVPLGKYFTAEFFDVAHTVPDTTGVVFRTPVGNVAHCADFRIDYGAKGEPLGLEEFERVAKFGIDLLMLDSTNAEREGFSVSEREVEKNLEKLFLTAKGRIVLATFSSMITRIGEILKIADKIGRHVAINGFSMKSNVQIAQQLGYIKLSRKDLIIPLEEIHKYKDEKILVLSTGAQGESNAGLRKIVNGENRSVRVKPGDTFIFSSSVIPGNERSVQTLKDNLARQGAKVFTSSIIDIHASGHAPQEELKQIIKIMKPKYLLPVHGYYFMRATHAELGQEVGMPKENTLLIDNGEVLELSKKGLRVTDERIDAYYVMVDGLGVGDVEEVVLRDRKILAQEGMVVIIATLSRQGARLLKNPDIISRGFIYLREHQGLLDEIRKRLRNLLTRLPRDREMDVDYFKGLIRDQIGQYLYTKTKRRPMVLPVIIEV
jgi:ribonuclease J